MSGTGETERALGALAQAVRNYLYSGDARDLRILGRLSSEALGIKPVGDGAPAYAERE